MKAISLFAGIGGFDLPLTRYGHEIVYVNEWDKYAAQTYEKNFKHRPDTRDIRSVPSKEIPNADIIVGGFPCQIFSIAGKRKGFDDTRGTLFFEIARILRDKRPRYFILENVKGLLSHDSGKTFSTILRILSDLGYEYEWQVLNSKNFGVPQNRERIFIVGHLRGEPRPEVFPFGSKAETNLAGDKKFIDLQLEGAKITNQIRTIQARYYKGWSTRYGENSGVLVGTLRTHKDGNGFREIKQGISPTIPARAREDGSGQPVIYDMKTLGSKTRRGFAKRGYTGALDTDRSKVVDAIRRLTPVECERLQGFPDNWTAGVSDTQRYKQLGNAVTVNVVEEIIKRL
jgi:DNA (cytosine-5)-methyltransferase 1